MKQKGCSQQNIDMKMLVGDFIQNYKQRNYINYCECIIYPDGYIDYAIPGHVEALLKFTGEPREVIDEKMPIWDSPLIWLVNYTGCISVWSQGYIAPQNGISNGQNISLKILIDNNLVSDYVMSM